MRRTVLRAMAASCNSSGSKATRDGLSRQLCCLAGAVCLTSPRSLVGVGVHRVTGLLEGRRNPLGTITVVSQDSSVSIDALNATAQMHLADSAPRNSI